MREVDALTASCLFYLFADRHLPIAAKDETFTTLPCSEKRVADAGLVGLLLGPALRSLQERQLVALALGPAPPPVDIGRLRSARFGPIIRRAQRPPFLYVDLLEEGDHRYTSRRSVLESVGKHHRRVSKWVDSTHVELSDLERTILWMLHALDGYAPVWEDDNGQALCALDEVTYLARMGGYEITRHCDKEARKAGYLRGRIRTECPGRETLEPAHAEQWEAWQAFRDADPALSAALDHRCLIGQELHERLLED